MPRATTPDAARAALPLDGVDVDRFLAAGIGLLEPHLDSELPTDLALILG